MKIKDILTKNPEVIHPDATLCEAARKMKQYDIGMLPVCERDRLVGTVTDRDITVRAIADGADPLRTKVREVMTSKISYCFEESDLEEAARMMEEKQIRRLAVLNSRSDRWNCVTGRSGGSLARRTVGRGSDGTDLRTRLRRKFYETESVSAPAKSRH